MMFDGDDLTDLTEIHAFFADPRNKCSGKSVKKISRLLGYKDKEDPISDRMALSKDDFLSEMSSIVEAQERSRKGEVERLYRMVDWMGVGQVDARSLFRFLTSLGYECTQRQCATLMDFIDSSEEEDRPPSFGPKDLRVFLDKFLPRHTRRRRSTAA